MQRTILWCHTAELISAGTRLARSRKEVKTQGICPLYSRTLCVCPIVSVPWLLKVIATLVCPVDCSLCLRCSIPFGAIFHRSVDMSAQLGRRDRKKRTVMKQAAVNVSSARCGTAVDDRRSTVVGCPISSPL